MSITLNSQIYGSIVMARRYINQKDCEKLVHAFITSKLDSCNSILFGLPAVEIDKLQRVQKTCSRMQEILSRHPDIETASLAAYKGQNRF
jgi:hypothetical protein